MGGCFLEMLGGKYGVSIRKVFQMVWNNIKICLMSPRFYIALILVAILFWQIEEPIRMFCAKTGYLITPWLFPHLTQLPYIQNIITLGIVLIFCDAPFIKENSPYIILRVGRKNWLYAQMLYVLIASFIYCLSVYIISVLLLFPYLEINGGWGKIIGTLAQTNASNQIGTISIEYQLLLDYKPWQAVLVSGVMCWLIVSFIGLLMMCINLFGKNNWGPIVGSGISFTSYLARIFSDMYAGYYFSPPTWMGLLSFGKTNNSPYPTLIYAIVFLIIGICVSAICSYLKFRKKPIEVITIV